MIPKEHRGLAASIRELYGEPLTDARVMEMIQEILDKAGSQFRKIRPKVRREAPEIDKSLH